MILVPALKALANERRALAKPSKPSLGWINGWLYRHAPVAEMFNDITIGDNEPRAQIDPHTGQLVRYDPAELVGYRARTGYDACTGWGSPNGAAFFRALVAKE